MMSNSYKLWDHKDWTAAGLPEDIELDCAEYVNQEDDGPDQLRGEWFYEKDLSDNRKAIIYGTFGNYNSPGASSYTYAEVYDMTDEEDAAAFARDLKKWEEQEEYIPVDE